jgi:hypothetical protein
VGGHVRRLRNRVRNVGGTHKQAMQSYTPVQTSSLVTGSAASPGAIDVMPLALVSVYPEPGGQYSTIGYQGLAPIYTPSGAGGAAIPATSPGNWAQLRAAGRP